jgi:hypothetical protein
MQKKPEKAATPMRPSWLTRIAYSLALVGFIPSALAGSSGWISLALGGGVLSRTGPTAFLVVAGLALFRAYQVLRYPAALDARPPNTLGWLLRWLGWLCMLIGTVSSVGLFVVKPITLLLFRSAGDSGIGYFIVGLALVFFASFGWLGCLIFEVSRTCGQRLTEGVRPPWSHHKQDFAVLGALLAAAISTPYLLLAAVGQPCGENNLAACVSTTQSEVHRVIGLPYGEPVLLESTVEEIEMRSTSGRRWSLRESPLNSLRGAGHPAAESSPSKVRIRVDAKPDGQAVVVELALFQGMEETSRFVTRFPKGAVLEKTAKGRTRIVVDLPANAQPGARSMHRDSQTGNDVAYDQLFIQIRSALGSEAEANEWPMRVQRPTTLLNSSSAGALEHRAMLDDSTDPACKGKLETTSAEELAFQGNLGRAMNAVTFSEAGSPGPHALLGFVDRIVCQEGEIWIVAYPDQRPDLRIRRYSAEGKLLRFVDTVLPPANKGHHEFDRVDGKSFREVNGRIRFERFIGSVSAEGKLVEKKREFFEVTP